MTFFQKHAVLKCVLFLSEDGFGVFLAVLNTWGLGSFARDWTCLLHWKHRLLSTRPPGKALPEDVNSLFYLKTKQNCCLLFPLSVYLSLCVNTIFLFNSYHVEDFNKMFSDPNCPYLLNSETLKTLWKCLSGASAWWQGSFTVTFFCWRRSDPQLSALSIVGLFFDSKTPAVSWLEKHRPGLQGPGVYGAHEWGASWFSLQTFTSSLCFHGAYLPCPLPGGVFPSPGPLSCNPCCWCWGDTAIRAYRVGKGLTPDISLLSSSAFELPCPPTSEPFWGSVIWRGFSLGGWVLCGHSLFNFCPSGSIVLISLSIFQCSLMSVCCALLSFSVSPYHFLILPPF